MSEAITEAGDELTEAQIAVGKAVNERDQISETITRGRRLVLGLQELLG